MKPFCEALGRGASLNTHISLPWLGRRPFVHCLIPQQQQQRRLIQHRKMDAKYASWTKSGLIERIQFLEAELRSQSHHGSASTGTGIVATSTSQASPSKKQQQGKAKGKRNIDPSKYATRYIALKLAYLGKNYGGYEFQASGNVETIEEHLWKALTKAHLIFPQDENVVEWQCCDYSKCGRTDRGVSAFGQVIGLRVRSNRPAARKRVKLEDGAAGTEGVETAEEDGETEVDPEWDPVRDELQYARMLNRILPPDIRILAWCPSPPPDFSARFSCRERQYRYFFTQPAFSPEPVSSGDPSGTNTVPLGWLNIEAMKEAAKLFEGEHDFRNFCKIDPAKMITNFDRTMYEVSVTEVEDVATALPYIKTRGHWPSVENPEGGSYPKVYSFNVKGSAFLWHQIRHMIGVLFLVGQGLESPSVVSEMLDTKANPRKPNFTMADEVPLVLWDCIFPAHGDRNKPGEALQWVHAEEYAGVRSGGIIDSVWANWREKKMDELLANQLLQEIATQQDRSGPPPPSTPAKGGKVSHRIYEGGNTARPGGKYTPLLKRDKLEEPEVQLEKFAKKKGYAGAEDMRIQKGYRNATADAGDE